MRHRNRRDAANAFPVTAEDWQDGRHREDPADRRNPQEVERALDNIDTVQGFTVMRPIDLYSF